MVSSSPELDETTFSFCSTDVMLSNESNNPCDMLIVVHDDTAKRRVVETTTAVRQASKAMAVSNGTNLLFSLSTIDAMMAYFLPPKDTARKQRSKASSKEKQVFQKMMGTLLLQHRSSKKTLRTRKQRSISSAPHSSLPRTTEDDDCASSGSMTQETTIDLLSQSGIALSDSFEEQTILFDDGDSAKLSLPPVSAAEDASRGGAEESSVSGEETSNSRPDSTKAQGIEEEDTVTISTGAARDEMLHQLERELTLLNKGMVALKTQTKSSPPPKSSPLQPKRVASLRGETKIPRLSPSRRPSARKKPLDLPLSVMSTRTKTPLRSNRLKSERADLLPPLSTTGVPRPSSTAKPEDRPHFPKEDLIELEKQFKARPLPNFYYRRDKGRVMDIEVTSDEVKPPTLDPPTLPLSTKKKTTTYPYQTVQQLCAKFESSTTPNASPTTIEPKRQASCNKTNEEELDFVLDLLLD